MWKVFPRLATLKFLLFAFTCFYFSILLPIMSIENRVIVSSFDDFTWAISISTAVIFCFLFFIWLCGKHLWRFVWKIPLIGTALHEKVCPDLNGQWTAILNSNFDRNSGEDVLLKLKIEADLFGFKISGVSVDNYQHSEVIQSEIYRDPRTGIFYISYIYEGFVPQPQKTDESSFFGAANLRIIFEGKQTILEGHYWTNRNWHNGLNTAGTISAKLQEEKND